MIEATFYWTGAIVWGIIIFGALFYGLLYGLGLLED